MYYDIYYNRFHMSVLGVEVESVIGLFTSKPLYPTCRSKQSSCILDNGAYDFSVE